QGTSGRAGTIRRSLSKSATQSPTGHRCPKDRNDKFMSEPTNKLEVIEISAIEAISRAEIDIQVATAKRYPRQLSKVKSDMMGFATLDQETAEACFYSLPRGGKTIQGPSVRLAEIALSTFGNCRAGTRIIHTQPDGDS